MNRCLQRAHVPKGMTKGRIHWSKRTQAKERPQQLQTYDLPTDDVENINSTNKGRGLLLANKPQFVPWSTERIQRHSSVTWHRSTHPKWKPNQTERSDNSLDWLQKAYDMVLQIWMINCLKMYKISHEVINVIESEIDSRRKKLSWSKDPKRRCTITLTIHNCHDVS